VCEGAPLVDTESQRFEDPPRVTSLYNDELRTAVNGYRRYKNYDLFLSYSCLQHMKLIFNSFLSISANDNSIDRLEWILTMVYVLQSYWACFGLYPSSCMW
jgi:hypothetical protein